MMHILVNPLNSNKWRITWECSAPSGTCKNSIIERGVALREAYETSHCKLPIQLKGATLYNSQREGRENYHSNIGHTPKKDFKLIEAYKTTADFYEAPISDPIRAEEEL